LRAEEFSQLRALEIDDEELLQRLLASHLVVDGSPYLAVQLLALKQATRMRRLGELTALHIFVVTLRCDHACEYCQVSRKNSASTEFDMSYDDAMAALRIVFDSPSPEIKIEFQGGESLLNFPLIRQIVLEAERMNETRDRALSFVIASNLVPLNEEILQFAEEHNLVFSTSLDGPADLHNQNRSRPGRNSHELTENGIRQIRARLGESGVSALMTTTRASLGRPEEIIDEYVRLGFSEIFLRYLSPYGFARKLGVSRRYGHEDWMNFYERGLHHIIELNRAGVEMCEVLASIYLRKMLTNDVGGYVDLATPTGAALSALVYNYDGDVYSSDEGRMLREMGDQTFRLGSVRTHSFSELLLSEPSLKAIEESFSSTSPMCSDCAFEPYCGSDPTFHYTTQGDMTGFKPTSDFCSRTMQIVPLLARLYEGDRFCRDLFERWASR